MAIKTAKLDVLWQAPIVDSNNTRAAYQLPVLKLNAESRMLIHSVSS
jgi:hypothetical protein